MHHNVYPKDQEMRMYCMPDLCARSLMMAHPSSNIIMNKIQFRCWDSALAQPFKRRYGVRLGGVHDVLFLLPLQLKKFTGGTFCSWLQRTNRISFQASKLLVPSHCIWARHFLICRKVSSSISFSLFWWASRFFCAWQHHWIWAKWRTQARNLVPTMPAIQVLRDWTRKLQEYAKGTTKCAFTLWCDKQFIETALPGCKLSSKSSSNPRKVAKRNMFVHTCSKTAGVRVTSSLR